jgi:DNA-binding FadR family transcriptional regulator
MVEHEQLISISRGIGGGFYSRRPEISAVLHAAAVYLMARKNTLSDLLRATNPLTIELARLAARCEDQALRAEIAELHERVKSAEHVPQSLHDFHAGEGEMMDILYKMAANPSLELVLRVLYQFGMSAFRTSLFDGQEELMQKRRSARVRLVKAVLDGDPDIAELVTRRNAGEMAPYMTDAVLEQQLDMMPIRR